MVQPLVGTGEIFGGLEVGDGTNDAHALLHACANSTSLPGLLSSLRGPWALVYWQAAAQALWFGRDVFGEQPCIDCFPECLDLHPVPEQAAGRQRLDQIHQTADALLQASAAC